MNNFTIIGICSVNKTTIAKVANLSGVGAV